uniref:Headcase domain-containing protein n=1 Tax=Panagrellus redivivus TaxID=6233 RepID=A0A7E4V2I1_PANRE
MDSWRLRFRVFWRYRYAQFRRFFKHYCCSCFDSPAVDDVLSYGRFQFVTFPMRMDKQSSESESATMCISCNCTIDEFFPGIKAFSCMRPYYWICNNCKRGQYNVGTAIISFIMLPPTDADI